jgi:hypothetical protein
MTFLSIAQLATPTDEDESSKNTARCLVLSPLQDEERSEVGVSGACVGVDEMTVVVVVTVVVVSSVVVEVVVVVVVVTTGGMM